MILVRRMMSAQQHKNFTFLLPESHLLTFHLAPVTCSLYTSILMSPTRGHTGSKFEPCGTGPMILVTRAMIVKQHKN